MTSVEKMSLNDLNDPLMRPTDLSLKTCLKYEREKAQSTPPDPTYQRNKKRKSSYSSDNTKDWRKRLARPGTIASPIPLIFGGGHVSVSSAPVADSAAKLVALDNLLLQCQRSSSAYDTAIGRSRKSSDSSNEMAPISSSLLDAVKNLAGNQRVSYPHAHLATASSPSPGKGRGCKRKGGWKFHDLSDESEGIGKRKRAYCQTRLENEILQLYQDRIIIKEVVGTSNFKPGESLLVIEPSHISDPDLVKHNTGLRMVFDRRQGTYSLQVLPFTIEQGSISNKNRVLSAIAKMLGENGAVLCPGIAHAQISQHHSNEESEKTRLQGRRKHQGEKQKNWLGFTPNHASDSSSEGEGGTERYRGRWRILNNASGGGSPSGSPDANLTVTPTDRLLITLNKELTKTQERRTTAPPVDVRASSHCQIWHVPSTGRKGKTSSSWPNEGKWCASCLRNIHLKSDYNNNATKSIY